MHDSYLLYYIFSTFPKFQEILIDKDLFSKKDNLLNRLPEYEPSDKVLNKIFKEL